MTKIEVEGERYPVTENLGFQGGHCAKAVGTPDGERIAVKRGGVWTWWTAYDKATYARERWDGRDPIEVGQGVRNERDNQNEAQ